MSSISIHQSTQNLRKKMRWLIVVLFAVIFILEFATPYEYVFGYLYIGPIVLTSSRLGQKASWQATLVGVVLTLLNIWVPWDKIVSIPTIVSRLIAVIALIMTAWLSNRNLQYQEAIAQTKAKLNAQEQLVNLREDFASTLTHDLKTPLLGAIETIKAFQQEKFGLVSPVQQKVLATMERSHRNSLQLVETLLDVYSNDIEGLKLDLVPVDLAVLAEEAMGNLYDLASSRRVYLGVSYADSNFRRSLWVNGDKNQLQRVFSNLLINAIDHTRRGGKVEVRLESQSSSQIVKIIDTGTGITKTELPCLFERFYQGHGDRSSTGSGLGLYLSRQIIEAHNGKIWAENQTSVRNNISSTFNTGAIFGFKLPVYPFEKPL
jgi:two-component system, NarL family, sensor kinase